VYLSPSGKVVPAKARVITGTPRDGVAPYPQFAKWCLAVSYVNGNHRLPMSLCRSGTTFRFYVFVYLCLKNCFNNTEIQTLGKLHLLICLWLHQGTCSAQK